MNYCIKLNPENENMIWNFLSTKPIEFIYFNTLFQDENTFTKLTHLDSDLQFLHEKNKFYPSGKSIKLNYNTKVRKFLKTNGLSSFLNSPIEDPSFVSKNGVEILAMISHENLAFLNLEDSDLVYFDVDDLVQLT